MVALTVLVLEHRQSTADLIFHHLFQGGFEPQTFCVASATDYAACLPNNPDLIIANFTSSAFSAIQALDILHERKLDIPLIVVAEMPLVGEAVAAVKHGA